MLIVPFPPSLAYHHKDDMERGNPTVIYAQLLQQSGWVKGAALEELAVSTYPDWPLWPIVRTDTGKWFQGGAGRKAAAADVQAFVNSPTFDEYMIRQTHVLIYTIRKLCDAGIHTPATALTELKNVIKIDSRRITMLMRRLGIAELKKQFKGRYDEPTGDCLNALIKFARKGKASKLRERAQASASASVLEHLSNVDSFANAPVSARAAGFASFVSAATLPANPFPKGAAGSSYARAELDALAAPARALRPGLHAACMALAKGEAVERMLEKYGNKGIGALLEAWAYTNPSPRGALVNAQTLAQHRHAPHINLSDQRLASMIYDLARVPLSVGFATLIYSKYLSPNDFADLMLVREAVTKKLNAIPQLQCNVPGCLSVGITAQHGLCSNHQTTINIDKHRFVRQMAAEASQRDETHSVDEIFTTIQQLREAQHDHCATCAVALLLTRQGRGEEHHNFQQASIDAILPRSKGGTYSLENTQLLCQACNFGKGSMSQDQWQSVALPKLATEQNFVIADGVISPLLSDVSTPTHSERAAITSWAKVFLDKQFYAHQVRRQKDWVVSEQQLVGLVERVWLGGGYIRDATGMPWPLALASLDRIDSSLGYQDGNLRLITTGLNGLKNSFSDTILVNYLMHLKTNSARIVERAHAIQRERGPITIAGSPSVFRDVGVDAAAVLRMAKASFSSAASSTGP